LLEALSFAGIKLISTFLPETISYIFFNIAGFTVIFFVGLRIYQAYKPINELYKLQFLS